MNTGLKNMRPKVRASAIFKAFLQQTLSVSGLLDFIYLSI